MPMVFSGAIESQAKSFWWISLIRLPIFFICSTGSTPPRIVQKVSSSKER